MVFQFRANLLCSEQILTLKTMRKWNSSTVEVNGPKPDDRNRRTVLNGRRKSSSEASTPISGRKGHSELSSSMIRRGKLRKGKQAENQSSPTESEGIVPGRSDDINDLLRSFVSVPSVERIVENFLKNDSLNPVKRFMREPSMYWNQVYLGGLIG